MVFDVLKDNAGYIAAGTALVALVALVLAARACCARRGSKVAHAEEAGRSRSLEKRVGTELGRASKEINRIERAMSKRLELLGAERSTTEEMRRSLASYLEPLAAATFELQARCRLLVLSDDFLRPQAPASSVSTPAAAFYAHRDAQYRELHTLYLLSDFLCCAEIARREAVVLCALADADADIYNDEDSESACARKPRSSIDSESSDTTTRVANMVSKIAGGGSGGIAEASMSLLAGARVRRAARTWRRSRNVALTEALRSIFRLLNEVELSLSGEGISAAGLRAGGFAGGKPHEAGLDGPQWQVGATAPALKRGDFQLYRGEQRAIAEVMLASSPLADAATTDSSHSALPGSSAQNPSGGSNAGMRWHPIGYAEFRERYEAKECSAVRDSAAAGSNGTGASVVKWEVRPRAEEGRWEWSSEIGQFRWALHEESDEDKAKAVEMAMRRLRAGAPAAETNAFAANFRKVHADIKRFPLCSNAKHRLTRLQRSLVNLLDMLDPPDGTPQGDEKGPLSKRRGSDFTWTAAARDSNRVQRYPEPSTRARVPVFDWRCHAGSGCINSSIAPYPVSQEGKAQGLFTSYMCAAHQRLPFALSDCKLKREFIPVAEGGDGGSEGGGLTVGSHGSAQGLGMDLVRLSALDAAALDRQLEALLHGAAPLLGPSKEELNEADRLIQERVGKHIGLGREVESLEELEGQFAVLSTGEEVPMDVVKKAEEARAAMAAELSDKALMESRILAELNGPVPLLHEDADVGDHHGRGEGANVGAERQAPATDTVIDVGEANGESTGAEVSAASDDTANETAHSGEDDDGGARDDLEAALSSERA